MLDDVQRRRIHLNVLELGGWAGPGVGLVSSIESDPSSKSMPKPRLPWPQWASCLSNTPPRHTRHTPVGRQPPHRDEVTRTRDTWHVSWQLIEWLIVTGTSMPVEFRNCLTHVKNFREMSTQLIFILTNASMFSRTIHLNISTESLHLHRIFMFWWNSKWFSAFCFKLIELLKYEYTMEAFAYELGRLLQSMAFVFYPFLPKVTGTPMLVLEGDVWKCVTFVRMNSCLTFRFASSYHHLL